MSDLIYPLTDSGVRALTELSVKSPDVFIEGDPDALLNAVAQQMQKVADEQTSPFRNAPLECDDSVFTILNRDVVAGPSKDREHSEFVYSELKASPAEMSDSRLLASINCFHAARYVTERWKSGKRWNSSNPADRTKHVKEHWLGANKESNAIARLWWLHEFSRRTAKLSQFDTGVILNKLAGNVNFYHQILDRGYLMSSDVVRAAIIDICIDTGLVDRNDTTLTSKMMQELNRKAGGINLDLLAGDELRNIIMDCIPKK